MLAVTPARRRLCVGAVDALADSGVQPRLHDVAIKLRARGGVALQEQSAAKERD